MHCDYEVHSTLSVVYNIAPSSNNNVVMLTEPYSGLTELGQIKLLWL